MQNTVLDMKIQGSTLITTKPLSTKPFSKFSYQRCAAWAWPYRLLFNLMTTSHCPPSLLKSLVISIRTGSPLGISAWSNSFVKSILWLYKPRIHCKININITIDHWTTGEYESRVSGDSLFWKPPFTQYRALNFLIVQSGFLLHMKYHVLVITLWSATDLLETIFRVSHLIRVWISSYIALYYSSTFTPDNSSIYFGV